MLRSSFSRLERWLGSRHSKPHESQVSFSLQGLRLVKPALLQPEFGQRLTSSQSCSHFWVSLSYRFCTIFGSAFEVAFRNWSRLNLREQR